VPAVWEKLYREAGETEVEGFLGITEGREF
jgi:hypothetical protein